MMWYICNYHEKVFSDMGELRECFYGIMCPEGDETYSNHCTTSGPFQGYTKAREELNKAIVAKPR